MMSLGDILVSLMNMLQLIIYCHVKNSISLGKSRNSEEFGQSMSVLAEENLKILKIKQYLGQI